MRQKFNKPSGRKIGLMIAFTAMIALPTLGQAQALPERLPPEMALIPSGDRVVAIGVPRLLETADEVRYRRIFDLQAAGDWKAADREIGQLGDTRLMGHILAQRYLSDKGYKASYPELKSWMDKFSDLPEAASIYKLANGRRSAGAPAPRKPQYNSARLVGSPDEADQIGGGTWNAGLSAWRAGDAKTAAAKFEAVAKAKGAKAGEIAAASYWAARSYARLQQPSKVTPLLRTAAQYPRTFYGLMARRALGMESAFNWAVQPLEGARGQALLQTSAAQRALALIQVGQIDRAEAEMLALVSRSDADTAETLMTLSQAARMPSLSLRLGVAFEKSFARRFDAALYPLPAWEPTQGYAVDPALIFALIRRESGFNPKAKSPAGASGLMQLMPATAQYIGGKKGKDLFDPEISMELGQDYVTYLLKDEAVNGDLLLLVAAYNAGPGSVAKWRKQFHYDRDPLLFMESIPSAETRQFVRHVMASMWIYRERLGQPVPSLDALASGKKPLYDPQLASESIAALKP